MFCGVVSRVVRLAALLICVVVGMQGCFFIYIPAGLFSQKPAENASEK